MSHDHRTTSSFTGTPRRRNDVGADFDGQKPKDTSSWITKISLNTYTDQANWNVRKRDFMTTFSDNEFDRSLDLLVESEMETTKLDETIDSLLDDLGNGHTEMIDGHADMIDPLHEKRMQQVYHRFVNAENIDGDIV
jgi:hypothetical protein